VGAISISESFLNPTGYDKADCSRNQWMTSNLKSTSSDAASMETERGVQRGDRSGWIKVGAIAAGSAVLGGLAAAWFYRNTLSQLREAENEIPDSDSEITEDERAEDF
jgi:hypothetical protein